MSIKISVAIATYNGARFIQAQLDSFVAQSRRPDELVITDDCSNDETLDVVRRFAETAPFQVRWSRNEKNLGYGGNFNRALMGTTGDLVFLSDQDDVWFPDKITRVAELAEAEPEALVLMNDAMLTDEYLNETALTKLGQIRSSGFGDSFFVMGCCAAIRREWLNLCLPLPAGQKSHDSWIVGLADEIGRKRIVPEVLQYYRRHDGNESQWIVNRTTPVSPWHVRVEVWRRRLREWFRSLAGTSPEVVIPALPAASMLDWARAAVDQSPPWLRDDLQRFLGRLQRQEEVRNTRRQIRDLPLPKRTMATYRFWRDGGYAAFSGVRSALRDVLKV